MTIRPSILAQDLSAFLPSRRVVEQLDEAACLELLSTGRIGRLIYNSRYGPVALPSVRRSATLALSRG